MGLSTANSTQLHMDEILAAYGEEVKALAATPRYQEPVKALTCYFLDEEGIKHRRQSPRLSQRVHQQRCESLVSKENVRIRHDCRLLLAQVEKERGPPAAGGYTSKQSEGGAYP